MSAVLMIYSHVHLSKLGYGVFNNCTSYKIKLILQHLCTCSKSGGYFTRYSETDYSVYDRVTGVRLRIGAKDSSLLHSTYTTPGARRATLTTQKIGRVVKLIILFHFVLRFIVCVWV